ncbi:hypothetical protein WJX82_002052 [Trebouxia sp. C0006]
MIWFLMGCYGCLIMYRIYRHNARRRWVRTVIRQQQPSPVEIKEWYDHLWEGVALLVRLFFGSFRVSGKLVGTVFEKCIAGIGTSYQPVVKGFDQVVGYLGQASSSAGNWTKRLFSKLLPKKQRWQQQQDTELLAGLKQEPLSKKGKSRKALKGKQQQKQKQQAQRKGRPTFLPSPATGPSKGGGVSSPRLSVSADAQSEPTSAFPGAAAPFDDSDSASPVIGARKAAGLPAKPASHSPVKTKFAFDATSGNVSSDVDAQSEAGSNPDAEVLKSDSSQGDAASVRAVSSSPGKADSSVPAKPATLPSRATAARSTPSQSRDDPVITATSPSVLSAKVDVCPAKSETAKLETIQAVDWLQPKGQIPEPQEAGQLPAPPKPRKRMQAVHKPKAAVATANSDAKKVAILADPKPLKDSAVLPQGGPAEPQVPAQTLPMSVPESSQPAQASVQDEEPKSLEQIVFGDNDDDAEQQNMCIVCWVMKRETTLAPCGHRVLCRGCTKELMSARKQGRDCLCPICRTEVESYILKQYDA